MYRCTHSRIKTSSVSRNPVLKCLKKRPVTQNMVHISSQALEPTSFTSVTFTNVAKHLQSGTPTRLSSRCSYQTHPSPPLLHFSWAHSLLVRNICSHVAGTPPCREYSLLHCIACHLEINKKGEKTWTFVVKHQSFSYTNKMAWVCVLFRLSSADRIDHIRWITQG